MKNFSKTRWIAFAFGAASLAASVGLNACGQPPAPAKPAPVSSAATTPQINSNTVPQNSANLYDVGQYNQTQINALIGTYTGTFQADDQDGNPYPQDYKLILSKAQSGSKTIIQAQFVAANWTFTAPLNTSYLPTAFGPSYTLVSTPVTFTAIDSFPFYLALQLPLNANNQFDPTLSPIISIVDSVSFYAVVGFNNDIQRH